MVHFDIAFQTFSKFTSGDAPAINKTNYFASWLRNIQGVVGSCINRVTIL
jgi:hypothetical protein